MAWARVAKHAALPSVSSFAATPACGARAYVMQLCTSQGSEPGATWDGAGATDEGAGEPSACLRACSWCVELCGKPGVGGATCAQHEAELAHSLLATGWVLNVVVSGAGLASKLGSKLVSKWCWRAS
eukprot:1157620-Pelagomonas_calceolata.AAC.2